MKKLQKNFRKSILDFIRLPLMCANGGFTLLEILVVVLIIGILGAIALPQYQRAVFKSRYSGMMPIAKALAEGNEVFFLEHGHYSENPADLVIAGRDKNAGAYPDGTRVLMYDDDGLSYVRVMNDNVPNARYLVYQKHSENFPDNIHCEALDTDDNATWLCRDALHGTPVNAGEIKSISGDDYTAYVLSGSTVGSTFDKSCEGSAPTEEGDTCPSGCGKMTATASCNPRTGEWGEPEFNDDSCPSPLPDDVATCENGTGTRVRHSQCKSDGSGYEYGAWEEDGCCQGEKPTYTITRGQVTGTSNWGGSINPGEWTCVNGQWQLSSFSSTFYVSAYNTQCTDFYNRKPGASNGGACSGTYTKGGSCEASYAYNCSNSKFTGNASYGSGCSTSRTGEYGCANSTFNGYSSCSAHAKNGCTGSTFNSGAKCNTDVAEGCAGAIMKAGSKCVPGNPGACVGAIFEAGSWCYSDPIYGFKCSAGMPAGSDSGAYAGECWNASGGHSASYCTQAGTPVGDSAPGKCWDGAGHQTDC